MAVDLDLFSRIVKHGSHPVATLQLARESGGEPQLVERILRMVASVGLVAQSSSPDGWLAARATAAMVSPSVTAAHRYVYDMITTAAIAGPEYLREVGFVAPVEPRDGILQFAHRTKQDVFGLMRSEPALMQDFNTFMGHLKGSRIYWYDWCPVEDIVFDNGNVDATAEGSVLMVDIGGGRGQDLSGFNTRYPNRGRLVLQDLPQVIDSIGEGDLDPCIERQTYDHFTTQPVKGARAYLMHHILHQWSDKYCLEILANTRAAMRPGYSKLLLNELVLPDFGATTYQCCLDIAMMAVNGVVERSRMQWRDLLQKAGFCDTKFWTKDDDGDGLIEAGVPS